MKIMKRICILCLALFFISCMASCKRNSELEDFGVDDALILVNEQTVMTVQEFKRLLTQQAVSHEIKGIEELDEKEFFIQQAEIALLSFFAKEYGLDYDRSVVAKEYDAHMLEIQDTDLYGDELLFSSTLQTALAMDNTTFREWNIDEALKDYNVKEFLDNLAQDYMHITNAEILKELMQQTILHLMEIYNVEILYPTAEINDLDFLNLL